MSEVSTIKISELATTDISLTDFIAKADANGLATKTTFQSLSNFLSTTDDVSFKGKLLIADTPVDGWYFAGESGTYTNAGGLVIDVSTNVVIIIVSDNVTNFEKIDVPVSIILDTTPTENSTNAVESGGVRDFINEIVINSVSSILENKVTSNVRDDQYISYIGNIFGAKPTHEVLVYPVLEGDIVYLKGQFTATDESAGTGAYCFFTADTTSDFIINTLVVKNQNEVVNFNEMLIVPPTANFLMLTRSKTGDDFSAYEDKDINTIENNASTALVSSNRNTLFVNETLNAVLLENNYEIKVENLMINFQGNAFWSEANYDVFKYKVDTSKTYRIKGQTTGNAGAFGNGSYGWYTDDLPTSLISFELVSPNQVIQYDEFLTPPSNANYLMVSLLRGVDDLILEEVVDGDNLGTLSNSMFPYKNKNLFTIGDSFVFLAHHIPKLLETTQTVWHGTTGEEGNGRELTYFPQLLHNNNPQFDPRDWHTQYQESDICVIMGGANDYLNTNVPLGTINDVELTTAQLNNGDLCTTIYQAVKTLISVLQTIDYSTKIVWVTQPEVGNYGGKPTATTTPNANGQGITMAIIAEAIVDVCKSKGIACFDTHNLLWSHAEMPLYTYDNLHPSNNTTYPSTDPSTESGGDKMGRIQGKFVNSL